MFKTIVETLMYGGPLMIPIFMVSLVSWHMLLSKKHSLRDSDVDYDKLTNDVLDVLKKQKAENAVLLCKGTGGFPADTIYRMLNTGNKNRLFLLSIAKEVMHEQYPKLEKGLSTISVLASVAPLLGLLGTVSGMVVTFKSIMVFGTGDPQSMAKGISEALITTQAGLIVAIPVLFFHNHLQKKAYSIMDGFEKNITKIINFISNGKPGGING